MDRPLCARRCRRKRSTTSSDSQELKILLILEECRLLAPIFVGANKLFDCIDHLSLLPQQKLSPSSLGANGCSLSARTFRRKSSLSSKVQSCLAGSLRRPNFMGRRRLKAQLSPKKLNFRFVLHEDMLLI